MRDSAWNKSVLGGFFKIKLWNADPVYSIARVSDHVLRHDTRLDVWQSVMLLGLDILFHTTFDVVL